MTDFADLDRKSLIYALENKNNAYITTLLSKAGEVRNAHIGYKVHLRGLIEISNVCRKDCLYCGIRRSNGKASRFSMGREEIIGCARQAFELGYGSVVIQSGERCDHQFTNEITETIREIKSIGNGALGITLSLGEQSAEVYKEWFEAGAHRYLLRIEASNPELFRKIHPNDGLHAYERRIRALEDLKSAGFLTGTGIMIGLPFQTTSDIADDLLFFKEFDAPMIGMGPYIPHADTPLAAYESMIPAAEDRLTLSLKTVALLRLLMPDINIAATTALEALHPSGREMALRSGANILMPNITPPENRARYTLYRSKERLSETAPEGFEIGFNEWGDRRKAGAVRP